MAIQIGLWIVSAYLFCGLLFAIPFVLKGAAQIDEGAEGGRWGFKLIIVPGTIVFWPLLVKKWKEKSQKPNRDLLNNPK